MNMNRLSTLGGALVGSVAASACCILPAVLGVAGAGSLGISAALAPYRPYLIGATILMLAAGFYLTYRRPQKATCGPDGCAPDHVESSQVTRFNKLVLWLVTIMSVGAIAYPELSEGSPFSARADAPAPLQANRDSVLVFTVSGMTCGACEQHITGALSRIQGVTNASASYQNSTVSVRYQPGTVTRVEIQRAIEGVGYKARAQ